MNYTDFPSVNSLVPTVQPQPITASVQPKNFMGTGTFPSGNGFNIGGPTGVSIQGGQGLWAGSPTLTGSPFSVDLAGNLIASKATIKGTITSGITGGQRVTMNGANNEIEFYDVNGFLAGSVKGALVGGLDTMLISSSVNILAYLQLLWTDNSTGQSSVLLSGGTVNGPSVSINTKNGSGGSKVSLVMGSAGSGNATLYADGGINMESLGPISFLPNGLSGAPVVTGSRGSNAALASLLTALAGLGLIVDSSS